MREIIEAGLMREVQLQSKLQAAPDIVSSNEFQRSVLSIIEECSPCSEPKLFMMAVVRELPRDGGESLADLRGRLVQCAQDLKAYGLIEISDEEYVFVPTTSPDQPDIVYGRGNRPEESKGQQVETERVRGEKEKDTPKETEDPVVSVAAEPQNRALNGSAEDADVLDLALELEGPSAPTQEAAVSPVEEAESTVEPPATGWMKPPRFMSLLGQARK